MNLEGWARTFMRVAAHQQKRRLFVGFELTAFFISSSGNEAARSFVFLRLRKILVSCCRFIIALFSIVFRHFRRFYAHPHIDSHALFSFVKQEKGIHIHLDNFGEILR